MKCEVFNEKRAPQKKGLLDMILKFYCIHEPLASTQKSIHTKQMTDGHSYETEQYTENRDHIHTSFSKINAIGCLGVNQTEESLPFRKKVDQGTELNEYFTTLHFKVNPTKAVFI
jgi:hypothetical protein